jgi:hypothetical protein
MMADHFSFLLILLTDSCTEEWICPTQVVIICSNCFLDFGSLADLLFDPRQIIFHLVTYLQPLAQLV